jgi:hypothetical protein
MIWLFLIEFVLLSDFFWVFLVVQPPKSVVWNGVAASDPNGKEKPALLGCLQSGFKCGGQ